MTPATPAAQPPRYDFTAAGDLSYALARVRTALHGVLATRTGEYACDLADPAEVPAPHHLWTGRHREEFERDYRRQMTELAALLDRLDTAALSVRRATGEALSAKRRFELEWAPR